MWCVITVRKNRLDVDNQTVTTARIALVVVTNSFENPRLRFSAGTLSALRLIDIRVMRRLDLAPLAFAIFVRLILTL